MAAQFLEGTLSCGFAYRVPTDYLNNMELLDALNELQDDNTLSFSAVVSILFGKDGKKRVVLTDDELRTFALWIDLAIPFSSSYVEANKWCDWHQQRFLYTNNKRSAFHWQELNDIRKEYGMEPVPLTGFKPGVEMPRRQKYWSE